MENFRGFPSNLQNASGFLHIQRQIYQAPYPYTHHSPPPLQPRLSNSILDEASRMRNFEPTVRLNSFPFVGPSRCPIPETAQYPIQPLYIPESGENKKLKAKIARANRKKVREMNANRRINTSSSASSSRSATTRSARPYSRSNYRSSGPQEHYIFYTPYNLKLSFVLQKLLTCTDVGELGRILLPKREAEENLPTLESKEGIQIVMKDVVSNEEWKMQYRFWANHKGRMYLFDHCDDFVKKNMLEVGDLLKLYQDELGNLYFTITKKEKQQEYDGNNYMSETTEEEDSSLRTLLEAFKHNDDSEANSLNNLYTSATSWTNI